MRFAANKRIVTNAVMLALYSAPIAVYAQIGYDFDLPTQMLADSLRAVGSKANINVAFEPAAVQGRSARALRGHYSAKQALDLLLEGTGLDVRTTQGGSFLIERADIKRATTATSDANPGRQIDSDTALTSAKTNSTTINGDSTTEEAAQPGLKGSGFRADTISPGASNEPADRTPAFAGVRTLSEIEVVAQAENTYTVTASSGATRTDTDLLDTPQSVSVITRKLIDDQQAQTLSDALANASGVQANSGSAGTSFSIRGFSANSVMNDGMNTGNASSNLPNLVPLWGVDSIEVLKGPEAILAGTGAGFGGAINFVTKQPQATPVKAISLGIGEYGQVQAGLDLAGVLAGNNQLTYRLVLSGDHTDRTVAGYDGPHDFYLAPSVRWGSDTTSLLLGVERIVSHSPPQDYMTAPNGKLDYSTPLRVLGSVEDQNIYGQTRAYYRFEQQLFGSSWSFRSRGSYSTTAISGGSWQTGYFLSDPAQGDMQMIATRETDITPAYTFQNDITGKFTTGPVSHQMVVGADYTHTKFIIPDLTYYLPSDPFNVYTSPPLPGVSTLTGPPYLSFQAYLSTSEVGYFLQDQMSWGEKWHLQVAVRDAFYHNYSSTTPDTQIWLPNLGIVYKITPDIAAYASTMRGYLPNTGLQTPTGEPLPPQKSKQSEAGLKFDLLDKRVSLTTAAYQIKVNNTAINIPDTNFYATGPGQTNKGIEVELKGQLTPALTLATSYTHTIGKTSDGTPTTSLSRNTMSFWMGYHFQQPQWSRWSLGMAVFARSASLGYTDNFSVPGLRNPGNARTDAHVAYTHDNWSLNLGIKDLFDRRIYAVNVADVAAPVDFARRTVMLTSKINF
jgi:iron complex outermembrane recepter protein